MVQESPFRYSIATRVREPYFRRYLDSKPGDRVLDLGCGVGYFAAQVSDRGAFCCGVDVDTAALRVARHGAALSVARARAEDLPFEDDSFDKILCSEVLEHVVDHRKAAQEIRRVTRPGGAVVVTVPSPEGVFGARIKSIAHGGREEGSPEAHQRDGYTLPQLRRLLEEAGMDVEEHRYTMVFLTELFMGMTKLGYLATTGQEHLSSQAEVIEESTGWVFRIFRRCFPLVYRIARLEDRLLSRALKGHMLVTRARVPTERSRAEECRSSGSGC